MKPLNGHWISGKNVYKDPKWFREQTDHALNMYFNKSISEIQPSSLHWIIKSFFLCCFKCSTIQIKDTIPNGCIYLYSGIREDTNYILESFVRLIPLKKSPITICDSNKLNIWFIFHLIKNIRFITILKEYTNSSRVLGLYIKVIHHISSVYEIKRCLEHNQIAWVVTCGAKKNKERLLLQSALELGLERIVLRTNFLPVEELYRFQTDYATYVAELGEYEAGLVKKYHPNASVFVCGLPLEFDREKAINDDYIGVVLTAFPYINKPLIQIAEQYAYINNKTIKIRRHPEENFEYSLNQGISQYCDDLDDCEMILSTPSTMVFIYLSLGKTVYCYKSTFDALYPSELLFDSLETLTEIVLSRKDFSDISREYLKYLGQDSKDAYHKMISEIML